MPDIYCYPNSDVLKNKYEIHDKTELLKAEITMTSARLFELQKQPVTGRFDFKHLQKIHAYIFQDIYDWAGRTRTVNIGKNNLFCLVQHIDSFALDVFRNYYPDCQKAKNDKQEFVHVLTRHYADLNALHPFREGNGRSQREFTRELCLSCGYAFNLTRTSHEEMLEASIASFNTENDKLEAIFQKAVTPINSHEKYLQALLKSEQLAILSKNDLPDKSLEK